MQRAACWRVPGELMSGLFHKASPTGWVTFQTISQQGFSILVFAIQAPLLGPHAFGLISVVMVLIGFCEFVLGSAATEALISIKEIEDLHFHTTSLGNLLLALLAACLFVFGADPFAAWFGDPELKDVLRVMSVLPVISALSAAPTASVKRDMRFRSTAVRAIAGSVCGGVVGLLLTLAGFGVWALVWQAIVQRLVATLTLWRMAPLEFRLAWSRRHFMELRHFATAVMFSRTMNWASGQVPRLLLGLFLGTTEVGLFSLAARLNDMISLIALEPKVTVERVNLRRFADDTAALRKAAVGMFSQLSALCFPLFIGGAALVPTLFHSWLDAHWAGAIVPSQLLLLMGVPGVTIYCTTAILLATNKQSTEALVSTVQTLSAVLVVLFAAPVGLVAAAAALALRPLVVLPMPLTMLQRKCGIPVRAILAAQAGALVAAAFMGIAVCLLGSLLQRHLNGVPLLLVLLACGVVTYTGGLLLLRPDLGAGVGRVLLRPRKAQSVNR
jgi:O-antigen/teichoic acid export membrane protein